MLFRSAKEIALAAVMTALLLAAQFALAAVQGVEIVTVLFLSYCVAFGARRGMVVAVSFSLFFVRFFPQRRASVSHLLYAVCPGHGMDGSARLQASVGRAGSRPGGMRGGNDLLLYVAGRSAHALDARLFAKERAGVFLCVSACDGGAGGVCRRDGRIVVDPPFQGVFVGAHCAFAAQKAACRGERTCRRA